MPSADGRPAVLIFHTGGTIGMLPAPGGRGIMPGGGEKLNRLLARLKLPGVRLVNVNWGNLPSPHMTPERMFELARDLDQALADPEAAGAVVTHGTDILVESAYRAELVLRSTKPVVFTGSMRFYSEVGYDGVRNLVNAVKACLLPLPPETGVTLLMTDRVFAVRDVAKINSLNIDAFEAPEAGPVAYVAGDRVVLTRPRVLNAPPRTVFDVRAIEPRVPLVTCYSGMDRQVLDHFMGAGMAGLVIEGFGTGNVPPAVAPALEDWVREDLPVVLTTRCLEGGVWPIYAYAGGGADLKRRGVVLAGRLSGPKARLRLMVLLGKTRNLAEIRRIFEGEEARQCSSHFLKEKHP